MKKSELSFKCVVPDKEAADKLCDILGVSSQQEPYALMRYNGKESFAQWGVLSAIFCAWPEPLMSYEDALKLIESVEPDAPKFDIKPFDRILARGANGSEWLARLYESKGIRSFMETGGCFCNQIIKYDGNEHLHRTVNPAAGWWECENGKPVWKTK